MVGWHHRLDGRELEKAPGSGKEQGSLAYCSPRDSQESSPAPRFEHAAAAAESRQSWPTLCDPIDGSPPGSPVPGIVQARTPDWVAISFSNA